MAKLKILKGYYKEICKRFVEIPDNVEFVEYSEILRYNHRGLSNYWTILTKEQYLSIQDVSNVGNYYEFGNYGFYVIHDAKFIDSVKLVNSPELIFNTCNHIFYCIELNFDFQLISVSKVIELPHPEVAKVIQLTINEGTRDVKEALSMGIKKEVNLLDMWMPIEVTRRKYFFVPDSYPIHILYQHLFDYITNKLAGVKSLKNIQWIHNVNINFDNVTSIDDIIKIITEYKKLLNNHYRQFSLDFEELIKLYSTN